ncbi:MAG: filamentous hemagglutinin N-terminal domain-containing protein, partial [Gammaproteobacteria bacterium]|nr:filamentous hemagglutinin N-terminal domain-containing protein [Gammaproteobacteria bacterium]
MSAKSIKNVTLTALAVFCSCALANPDGPQVVSGSATFSQPNANTLNVTNSHNAIINWQGFNIGAGQTTNFIQPSRNSAVLNRVMSNNPSRIYGNLNSNGKVFLINQHGLMIGAGARINTAGFYGSTLNITNEDFLKGKLNFNGGGFGGIQNHGYIHAGPGGNVVLIAPDIENGGVIEVDNGNVILAAGESILITSLNDASIEFDVQSHDDNSIINLGDIIAKQGAARLFAGNLKHSGSINATGIVKNADGSISLVAQADIEVTAGATITADGEEGGDIRVQSLQGDVRFSGAVSARGESGQGGRVEILGDRVGLFGDAKVDAAGKTGGGDVLIGGDYQGQGDIQTAIQTQVGGDASIHADAIESGDGGKVIVWADEITTFLGEVTATAGAASGDGGFIEVSGKSRLDFRGWVDASATNGQSGSVLFDPHNLTIETPGTTAPPELVDFVYGFVEPNSSSDSIIDPLAITSITDTGTAIFLQANNDIIINDAILTSEGGSGGEITLQSGRSILINADITTDNGTLRLYANDLAAIPANRDAGQSEIRMAPGTRIDAGSENIEIWMNSGVAGSSGDITLDNLNASHIVIKHNGLTDGSDILQNSGSVITASSLFIDHDGPANGSIGSAANPLNLVVDSLGAHIHAPTTGGIFIDAQPISTGVTVGNTCYGTGTAPGCDTFGSHLIKGLETVNGGGGISFHVAGDIVVIEPIRVDDVFSIGNAGDIALAATGTIISNADIFNNIVGGGIDFSATNVSLNSGTYRGLITTSGAGNPVVNGAVNFAGVALDIGSTLTLNANTLTMSNSSTFDGLLVVNGGTLNLAGTTLTLNSGLNWTNTSVISSGVLNLPLGAVFNISTGVTNTFDNIAVNIAGNTNYSAGNLGLQNGSSISNSGIFDFAGNIGIADFGGATSSFSNLDGGLIVKSAGATSSIDSTVSSSNAGSVDVQTGSLDLNLPSWTIGVGDTLSGNGTYIGNVINNGGIVRPGGQGSVGTLTVFGDFTNNLGKLEIEIDSAVTHDVLAVTNTLGYGNVAGSILDISLIAFVPSAGEMHNVITCVASCDTTTQFGTVIEPGGVTHNISYNANDLNLTVAAAAFFWDGGGALNNWFDPLNWSLDILPNPGTDVVLVNGDNVIFDGGAVTIASLTLNIGSSLNLTTGTLTNTGILTINAGASMAVSGGNLVNNGNA